MPITVGYGPSPGAIGAAARDAGGAAEILRGREIAAQYQGQLLAARMQQASQESEERRATEQTNVYQDVHQADIASRQQLSQQHDYAQLYAQHQQESFQAQQQNRLFDQQQKLEQTRQTGRDSRLDTRMESAEQMLSMRLSAPEQQQLRKYQALQAQLDSRRDSKAITPEEHAQMSRQIQPAMQALVQRGRAAQNGNVLQSQIEMENNAAQAGHLRNVNFQASLARNPDGSLILINGSPAVLDQHGIPKPVYPPAVDVRAIERIQTQVLADMPNATPEQRGAEARRRAIEAEDIMNESVQRQVRRRQGKQGQNQPQEYPQDQEPPPGMGMNRQPLGTIQRPHPNFNAGEVERDRSRAENAIRTSGAPNANELVGMVDESANLLRVYGDFANMGPRNRARFQEIKNRLFQLIPRGTQGTGAGATAALPTAPAMNEIQGFTLGMHEPERLLGRVPAWQQQGQAAATAEGRPYSPVQEFVARQTAQQATPAPGNGLFGLATPSQVQAIVRAVGRGEFQRLFGYTP